MASSSCIKSVKIRLNATYIYRLASSLLTTCSRLVIIKLEKCDIILMTATCVFDCEYLYLSNNAVHIYTTY